MNNNVSTKKGFNKWFLPLLLVLVFILLIIQIGWKMWIGHLDDNAPIAISYLKVNVEEGTVITEEMMGYDEILKKDLEDKADGLILPKSEIINKCANKDLQAGTYFYKDDLVECN